MRGRPRPLAAGILWLAPLSASVGVLWTVSRGKWSDPLIDTGREWIVPDALARGGLLYRDVVYWFGPFTPYFHAAFFRIFGSSLQTLVAAGVVATAGCLAALFLALSRVTGRREAFLWSALAIPALFFMPNAGGSLLGMGYRIWHAAAFALLAVWAAARGGSRPSWLLLAGALAGLSGLCRTEWGLASAAAVLLVIGLRRPSRRWSPREAGAALAGFLLVFGGVLAGFLAAAGPRAVLTDGHVLFSRLPEETRAFLVAFSGVRDWRRGALELAYSAAMWAGAFLLVETIVAGEFDPRGRRGRVTALAVLLVILALTAAAGGASGAIVWSAAPAVSAAALLVALRRPRGARRAALAAFGLLGLALSSRRPFHIGDSAYVGPPLLFAFLSAAGLLRLRVTRLSERPVRERVRAALAWALALATGIAFAARLRHYAAWDGEPIAGTGRLLTARPELAREIEGVSRAIRAGTAPGEGLVVFPEGELLNLLSQRRNPIRHMLYLPGYLTDTNEEEILRELESARPRGVVLCLRPTSEYGRGLFGADYGRRIRAWIGRNYELSPYRAPGAPARVNPRFLYGFRRAD